VIAQRSRHRAVTDKDQKTSWGKRIAERTSVRTHLGQAACPVLAKRPPPVRQSSVSRQITEKAR